MSEDLGGVSGPFYTVMVVISMDGEVGEPPTDWYEPVRNSDNAGQIFTDIEAAKRELAYCKERSTEQKYILVTTDLNWRQLK